MRTPVVAFGLGLGLALTSVARAGEPPPPVKADPRPGPSIVVEKADGNADGDDDDSVRIALDVGDRDRARDDLDLSPATVERLSDQQLFDLLMAKQNRPKSREEIWVPLGFFSTIIGVTTLVLIFRYRRELVRHETIRLSIEKGHPISPDLLVPGRTSTLRRGLVLLGTGVGLGIMLAGTSGRLGVGAIGLLPAMIGAAYLLIWWLESRERSGAPAGGGFIAHRPARPADGDDDPRGG